MMNPSSRMPLCMQFKRGKCNYGRNCKFSHIIGTRDGGNLGYNQGNNMMASEGNEIRSRENVCWWSINERRCPYGDKCVYSHDPSPKNVEETRENAAITLLGNRATGVENKRVFDEYQKGFQNLSCNADEMQENKRFWKTRICNNWGRTGSCPYGAKCHFTHGKTDMQKPGSLPVQESKEAVTIEHIGNAAKDATSIRKRGYKIAYEQLGNGKRRLIWWNNVEQVNGIYADWI